MAKIRRARADDHAALLALLREADELHARMLPSFFRPPAGKRGAATNEGLLRRIDAGTTDEDVAVAEDDGVVIALVHTQIYDTPAIASMVPKRRAHIDSLIVTGTARRRGIGRSLVAHASDWARRQGAAEILLTVWAGNDAADRFYEALGFDRISSVLGRTL